MEFENMLDEIYNNLEIKKKNKLILPNIEVNITTTNTYWTNIKKLLKTIKRGPDHFVQIMNKELVETNWKTASKSDGIVMIGKVKKEQLTKFTQNYIRTYVLCKVCKSHNTILQKNPTIRKYQLKCNNCNSINTV